MAKSFCNGCRWWEWLVDTYERFHYCARLNTEDLESRKVQCGGKMKEPKTK